MREVLTYSRRGNRFTPRQAESWAAHQADWVIPEEAVDRPDFALAELVRPRGAADRRDRLGHRRGDRGAGGRASRPQRAGPRGVAARHRRLPVAGGRGRRGQRPVLLRRRGLVAGAPARARPASPSCGPSSPTRGARPSTTSGGWSTPANAALASSRLDAGRRVAAGHRLGRLRRPDGGGARRRADPGGRRRRAVGRATGHPVRAQGPGRRSRHHRPAATAAGPTDADRAPEPGLHEQVLDPQALRLAVGALGQAGEGVGHTQGSSRGTSRSS